MEQLASFWWLWSPMVVGFLITPFLSKILWKKAFLTLEEVDGKAKLILENTKGEELQRIKVKVILPEGLSVKQIRGESEGEVRVENGSIDWSLETLGKHDRQVLEFNMTGSSIEKNGSIEFISEPSVDESYHFDKHGLQWKIYSQETHKVRTLLYRIGRNESASSEYAWKIQV